MFRLTHLVRIAALAAGVALGSLGSTAQSAVTLTFPDLTCNGMSMVDTGGGNFTVNCLQLTCTATATPPSPAPGTDVVVNASCTGQAPVNLVWTAVPGNAGNCPANVGQPTGGVSPQITGLTGPVAAALNCSYKVTGTDASNQIGSKTLVVSWSTAPPPAPTNCSVSATPLSMPNTGGTTNVTVNCTGQAATNWTINRNGVLWQSPSGNNVTIPDALPANGGTGGVTYTYTAVPFNGATQGSANASNNVVTVQGTGGGGGGSCGTFTVQDFGDIQFDGTVQDLDLGKGDKDVAVFAYTAQASDVGKITHLGVVEQGSGAHYYTVWASKTRCEMTGSTQKASNNSPNVFMSVNGTQSVNMAVGEKWYFMVRNWRATNSTNSCSQTACGTRVSKYLWQ